MSHELWSSLFAVWVLFYALDVFVLQKRRALKYKKMIVDGIIADLKESDTTLVITEEQATRLFKNRPKELM